MKCIVTGANGFLGKTFCEIVSKNNDIKIFGLSSQTNDQLLNPNVTYIKCDVNNFSKTQNIFNQINPDFVFHFASTSLVKNNNIEILESNISLIDKILRCSKQSNFIFSSSATVYGQNESNNYTFNENSELKPESIYATIKVMSEELIKFYYRIGWINKYLIYRYVAHVGKNATHGVLIDIFNKMKTSQDFIEIFGSYPGTIKPFLLASQSMNITLNHSINFFKNNNNGIFNISPNDNISVDDLVSIVMKCCNKKLNKKWLGDTSLWKGDQKYLSVSSKFEKNLISSSDAIKLATYQLLKSKL